MKEGVRFSQVYLDRSTPVNDSVRMRNRISAIYWDMLSNDKNDLISLIQKETGAKVPFTGASFSISNFFETAEIRDLLDSITIIYNYYVKSQRYKAIQWHTFISRVLREENVGYRLDGSGGVHFFVDEEFDRNRVSLIFGLTSQPAVSELFSKAYSFLDASPPDTSSAVKAIFEAIEVLYKHLVDAGGKDILNSYGIQNKIKPLFQQAHNENPIEAKALDHMMDSLCDWIDAGHMYRHGQKVEEPAPPTLEFAVLYLSQGASYLRLLLALAHNATS